MRTLRSDQGRESSRQIFIDFRSSSTLGPIFFSPGFVRRRTQFLWENFFFVLNKTSKSNGWMIAAWSSIQLCFHTLSPYPDPHPHPHPHPHPYPYPYPYPYPWYYPYPRFSNAARLWTCLTSGFICHSSATELFASLTMMAYNQVFSHSVVNEWNTLLINCAS